MSGCTENHWALSSNDEHLKRAFNMARELGKTTNDHDDLVKFLKSVPAEKLWPFAEVDVVSNIISKIPIGPVIESMSKCRI